eukprot:CAMPEP_0195103642 /NCGR_PEP_ID=MMETSP0448-20130528/72633_1 /TAXON_ID=66468 /ORGANISM="Heterocapsa triquestra, Strain CCMP 448" /LENGTH=173 /DNA_ID=CAMNT_0040139365 /DNA_START=80 /DNA_END=601 /DNA_ORIENTATION=+
MSDPSPQNPEMVMSDTREKARNLAKQVLTWQRLKFYVLPLIIGVVAVVVIGAVFPDVEWPLVIVLACVSVGIVVALASKSEVLYNELMDAKYELKGLSEVAKMQLELLRTVGEFVDKVDPKIEAARAEMKAIMEKIEKPFEGAASGIRHGVEGAEWRIEETLGWKHDQAKASA